MDDSGVCAAPDLNVSESACGVTSDLRSLVCYLGEADIPAAQPAGLIVLTLSGDRIAAIPRFLDPALDARLRTEPSA